MPILNDSAKISVEFVYEWINPDGSKEEFQMKFLHNETGPVVQIFNGLYEPIELPANMFVEVGEFLIRQGAIRGLSGAVESHKGSLPLPSIGRRPKTVITPPSPVLRRPSVGIGIESFQSEAESQEDAGASQITAATADNKTADGTLISKEKANELLQLRLDAKSKANMDEKKIKRN